MTATPRQHPGPVGPLDLDASLKRIAWAYGCARKGSAEETELCTLLLRKAAEQIRHRVYAELRAQLEAQTIVHTASPDEAGEP